MYYNPFDTASVFGYQHILAWRKALEQIGLQFSNASIHRRIGMSGNLICDLSCGKVDASLVQRRWSM